MRYIYHHTKCLHCVILTRCVRPVHACGRNVKLLKSHFDRPKMWTRNTGIHSFLCGNTLILVTLTYLHEKPKTKKLKSLLLCGSVVDPQTLSNARSISIYIIPKCYYRTEVVVRSNVLRSTCGESPLPRNRPRVPVVTLSLI